MEVPITDSIIKHCIHVPNYQNVPHKHVQISPNKNKAKINAISKIIKLISESTVVIRPEVGDFDPHSKTTNYFKIIHLVAG